MGRWKAQRIKASDAQRQHPRLECARTPVGSAMSAATRMRRQDRRSARGAVHVASPQPQVTRREAGRAPIGSRREAEMSSTAARLRWGGVGRVGRGAGRRRPDIDRTWHWAARAAPSHPAAASRPVAPADPEQAQRHLIASLIERRSSKGMFSDTEHHPGVRNRRVSLQSPS